jgi:hypothetical protein
LAVDKKKIGADINGLYANNEIDDLVEVPDWTGGHVL